MLHPTMQEIQLKLTIEEINLVFKALGELPFKQVYDVIGKINAQATPQLKSAANGPTFDFSQSSQNNE